MKQNIGVFALYSHRVADGMKNDARDVQGARGQSQSGYSLLVFVPAHPIISNGQKLAEYETRKMSDGVAVLPAFTTVKRLIEQLGKSQPWLRVPIQDVIDLMGPDHVAVDPVVDTKAWRWTAHELDGFASHYRRNSRDMR